MDEARQFIANDTDRDEDITEKTDTALIGLAAQLLNTGEADEVVLLTTDKPAGRAAETLLPTHGFGDASSTDTLAKTTSKRSQRRNFTDAGSR